MSGNDIAKEQLLVILTTTLSLLTAWSWNDLINLYIDKYHDRSLRTKFIIAIFITFATFILINWLMNVIEVEKRKMKKLKKSDLTEYVMEGYKS